MEGSDSISMGWSITMADIISLRNCEMMVCILFGDIFDEFGVVLTQIGKHKAIEIFDISFDESRIYARVKWPNDLALPNKYKKKPR